MKISVTSYSFSQIKNEYSQIQMVALAKEIGFDGIEFTDLTPPEGTSAVEYAKQIKAEAEKQGIDLVSYTVHGNLLNDDFAGEITRLKKQVDVAKTLGVPTMRHDAYFAFPENGPKDFEYYFDKTVDGFKQVNEYAKSNGIKLCTENHGLICQDSERIERIINAVNDSNFGWLVDIGNFLCVDESPIDAVTRAAKYAFHVHLKDFVMLSPDEKGIKTRGGNVLAGTILGKGIVPVKECVEIIKKSGYSGYYTVEFEGKEPCLDALKEALEFAKTL